MYMPDFDVTKIFTGGDIEKAAEVLKTRSRRYGPVAWCKWCSRRHRRRMCALVPEERVAKSGRTVIRLVHPKPRPKARPKTKARKS